MKAVIFLIRKSRDSAFWLDGWDGTSWEWTINKSKAWPFRDNNEAQRKLAFVHKQFPDAEVFISK